MKYLNVERTVLLLLFGLQANEKQLSPPLAWSVFIVKQ